MASTNLNLRTHLIIQRYEDSEVIIVVSQGTPESCHALLPIQEMQLRSAFRCWSSRQGARNKELLITHLKYQQRADRQRRLAEDVFKYAFNLMWPPSFKALKSGEGKLSFSDHSKPVFNSFCARFHVISLCLELVIGRNDLQPSTCLGETDHPPSVVADE